MASLLVLWHLKSVLVVAGEGKFDSVTELTFFCADKTDKNEVDAFVPSVSNITNDPEG